MSSPPDPFEFLKSLWGPMGLPLAGLGASTSAMSEIDRRIAELRSVETWLNMNLSVLRMSIQGLEMQKAGLAAMQSAASAAEPPPPQGSDDPAKK
ncbi:MAG TPA: PhaM family polyhydroxyalkanoate granule multifunctional regulatory protein [Burkholderiales bacterium]|nr:PhaM family polyhydroxyalkanoate granule multifunctional regulatory protein [Burkholderiales bacterium]HYA47380.1 PhaM family polyhydroxyalkanoate granule multifunctional regulatory protein [Burkholderiales bacterium]